MSDQLTKPYHRFQVEILDLCPGDWRTTHYIDLIKEELEKLLGPQAMKIVSIKEIPLTKKEIKGEGKTL